MAELRSSPGRIALVTGQTTVDPLRPLAEALGLEITSVGRRLTVNETAPAAVREILGEAILIDDADILMAPQLNLDPLALLRDLSRRHPVVLNWPGAIRGGEATYSEHGRRDHYQRRLVDAVILHPMARQFPDQPAYRLERIP
jgi:hypothetical protein